MELCLEEGLCFLEGRSRTRGEFGLTAPGLEEYPLGSLAVGDIIQQRRKVVNYYWSAAQSIVSLSLGESELISAVNDVHEVRDVKNGLGAPSEDCKARCSILVLEGKALQRQTALGTRFPTELRHGSAGRASRRR